MPKAKTRGSKNGLVKSSTRRIPPTTIQEGEEEVCLDLILDSVAAHLCHERLILTSKCRETVAETGIQYTPPDDEHHHLLSDDELSSCVLSAYVSDSRTSSQ